MLAAGDGKAPVQAHPTRFPGNVECGGNHGGLRTGQSLRPPVRKDQASATGTRLTMQDLTHTVSPRFPIWEAECGNAARPCLQL